MLNQQVHLVSSQNHLHSQFLLFLAFVLLSFQHVYRELQLLDHDKFFEPHLRDILGMHAHH